MQLGEVYFDIAVNESSIDSAINTIKKKLTGFSDIKLSADTSIFDTISSKLGRIENILSKPLKIDIDNTSLQLLNRDIDSLRSKLNSPLKIKTDFADIDGELKDVGKKINDLKKEIQSLKFTINVTPVLDKGKTEQLKNQLKQETIVIPGSSSTREQKKYTTIPSIQASEESRNNRWEGGFKDITSAIGTNSRTSTDSLNNGLDSGFRGLNINNDKNTTALTSAINVGTNSASRDNARAYSQYGSYQQKQLTSLGVINSSLETLAVLGGKKSAIQQFGSNLVSAGKVLANPIIGSFKILASLISIPFQKISLGFDGFFTGIGIKLAKTFATSFESELNKRNVLDLDKMGTRAARYTAVRSGQIERSVSRSLNYRTHARFREDLGRVASIPDTFVDPRKLSRLGSNLEETLAYMIDKVAIQRKPKELFAEMVKNPLQQKGVDFLAAITKFSEQATASPREQLAAYSKFAKPFQEKHGRRPTQKEYEEAIRPEREFQTIGLIGKVASIPLRFKQRIIDYEAIRQVEKRAKQYEATLPDLSKSKGVTVVTGGFQKVRGKGSEQLKHQAQLFFPEHDILPVRDTYTDRRESDKKSLLMDKLAEYFGYKASPDNADTFQNVEKLVGTAYKGFNPDAIRIAAKIKAVKNKYPNLPISATTFSGGTYPLEQALHYTTKMGVDAQGVGMGAGLYGLTGHYNKNYTAVIGQQDPLTFPFQMFKPSGNTRVVQNFMKTASMLAHDPKFYFTHPSVQDILSQQLKGFVKSDIRPEESTKTRDGLELSVMMAGRVPAIRDHQKRLHKYLADPKAVSDRDVLGSFSELADFMGKSHYIKRDNTDYQSQKARGSQPFLTSEAMFTDVEHTFNASRDMIGKQLNIPQEKMSKWEPDRVPAAIRAYAKAASEVPGISHTLDVMGGKDEGGKYSFFTRDKALQAQRMKDMKGMINYLNGQVFVKLPTELEKTTKQYIKYLESVYKTIEDMVAATQKGQHPIAPKSILDGREIIHAFDTKPRKDFIGAQSARTQILSRGNFNLTAHEAEKQKRQLERINKNYPAVDLNIENQTFAQKKALEERYRLATTAESLDPKTRYKERQRLVRLNVGAQYTLKAAQRLINDENAGRIPDYNKLPSNVLKSEQAKRIIKYHEGENFSLTAPPPRTKDSFDVQKTKIQADAQRAILDRLKDTKSYVTEKTYGAPEIVKAKQIAATMNAQFAFFKKIIDENKHEAAGAFGSEILTYVEKAKAEITELRKSLGDNARMGLPYGDSINNALGQVSKVEKKIAEKSAQFGIKLKAQYKTTINEVVPDVLGLVPLPDFKKIPIGKAVKKVVTEKGQPPANALPTLAPPLPPTVEELRSYIVAPKRPTQLTFKEQTAFVPTPKNNGLKTVLDTGIQQTIQKEIAKTISQISIPKLVPPTAIFKEYQATIAANLQQTIQGIQPQKYLFPPKKTALSLLNSQAIPQQNIEAVPNTNKLKSVLGAKLQQTIQKDALRTGANLTEGLTIGIESRLQGLRKISTVMATEPSKIVKEVNEIHSPSRLFKHLGEAIGAGFEQGLSNLYTFLDQIPFGVIVKELLLETASAIQGFVQKSNKHVRELVENIGKLGTVFIGLTSAFPIIRDFVVSSVQASINLENINRKLDFATGSKKASEEVLHNAKELKLNISDALDSAGEFSAALEGTPIQGKVGQDVFKNFQKYFAARGGTQDQQQRASLQLEQIAAIGQIQWTDLRPLSQAVPGIQGVLARSQGINPDELRNRLTTGGGLGTDAVVKFSQQAAIEAQAGLSSSLDTTLAASTNLTNSITLLQAALGDAFKPVYKVYLNTLASIMDFLGEHSHVVVNEMFAFVVLMSKPIWGSGARVLWSAFKDLGNTIKANAIALKQLYVEQSLVAGKVQAIGIVGKMGFDSLKTAITGVYHSVKAVVGEFLVVELAIVLVNQLIAAFSDLSGEIGKSAREATKSFKEYQVLLKTGKNEKGATLTDDKFLLGKRNWQRDYNPFNTTSKESSDTLKAIKSLNDISSQTLGTASSSLISNAISDVNKIDRKLEDVQAKRSVQLQNNPDDIAAVQRLNKQQQDIIADRYKAIQPAVALQAQISGRIKALTTAKEALEALKNDDNILKTDYITQSDTIDKNLKELNDLQTKLTTEIGKTTSAYGYMRRELEKIAATLEDVKEKSEIKLAKQKLKISDNLVISPATRQLATQKAEESNYKTQASGIEKSIRQRRNLLSQDTSQSVIKAFGFDENTGSGTLKLAIERTNDDKQKYILGQLQEQITAKKDLSQLQTQISEARLTAYNQQVDLTKSVADYYIGISDQAELSAIDTKKLLLSNQTNEAQSKLRKALEDGHDNIVTQYVDSIIQSLDQKNSIADKSLEAQRALVQFNQTGYTQQKAYNDIVRSIPIDLENQLVDKKLPSVKKENQLVDKKIPTDEKTEGFNSAKFTSPSPELAEPTKPGNTVGEVLVREISKGNFGRVFEEIKTFPIITERLAKEKIAIFNSKLSDFLDENDIAVKFKRLGEDFYKPLIGNFWKINHELNKIDLTPFFAATGNAIADGLKSVQDLAVSGMSIASGALTDYLKAIGDSFNNYYQEIKHSITDTEAFKQTKDYLLAFSEFINQTASDVSSYFISIYSGVVNSEALAQTTEYFAGFTNYLSTSASNIRSGFQDAFANIAITAKQLSSGISTLFGKIIDDINPSEKFNRLGQDFNKFANDAGKTFLKIFAKPGTTSLVSKEDTENIALLKQNLEGALKFIQANTIESKAWIATVDAAKKLYQDTNDVLANQLIKSQQYLQTSFDAIVASLSNIPSIIADAFIKTVDWNNRVAIIGEQWNELVRVTTDWLTGVLTPIQQAYQNLVSGITTATENTINWIKETLPIQQIMQGVNDSFAAIGAVIDGLIEKTSQWFQGIQQAASALGQGTQELAQNASTGLTKVANDFGTGIQNAWNQATDWITGGSKIKPTGIVESVGGSIQKVKTYADLEKHHPSAGVESGNSYDKLDGKLEEVRNRNGQRFVKKDFILDGGRGAPVASPVGGIIKQTGDEWNTTHILDPQTKQILATFLHLSNIIKSGTEVKPGDRVGNQSDVGSAGSVHVHAEMTRKLFESYIPAIISGDFTKMPSASNSAIGNTSSNMIDTRNLSTSKMGRTPPPFSVKDGQIVPGSFITYENGVSTPLKNQPAIRPVQYVGGITPKSSTQNPSQNSNQYSQGQLKRGGNDLTPAEIARLTPQGRELYQYRNDPRVLAVADTVARAEGTDFRGNSKNFGYGMLIGGENINDFSTHPFVGTGRKPRHNSTASGRYQMMNFNWDSGAAQRQFGRGAKSDLQNVFMGDKAPSFSPGVQDLYFLQSLKQRGVLDEVLKGDIPGTFNKSGVNSLAAHYASLENLNGKGYYPGQKTPEGMRSQTIPFTQQRLQARLNQPINQASPTANNVVESALQYSPVNNGNLKQTVDEARQIQLNTNEQQRQAQIIQSQQDLAKEKEDFLRKQNAALRTFQRAGEQLDDSYITRQRNQSDLGFQNLKNPSPKQSQNNEITGIIRKYDDLLRDNNRAKRDATERVSDAQKALATGEIPDGQSTISLQERLAKDNAEIESLKKSIPELEKLRAQAVAESEKLFKRDESLRLQNTSFELRTQELTKTRSDLEAIKTQSSLTPYRNIALEIPALERKLSLQESDLELEKAIADIEEKRYKNTFSADAVTNNKLADEQIELLKKQNLSKQEGIELTFQQADANAKLEYGNRILERENTLLGIRNDMRQEELKTLELIQKRNPLIRAGEQLNIQKSIDDETRKSELAKKQFDITNDTKLSPLERLQDLAKIHELYRIKEKNANEQFAIDTEQQNITNLQTLATRNSSQRDFLSKPGNDLVTARASQITSLGGNQFEANALLRPNARLQENNRYAAEIDNFNSQAAELKFQGLITDDQIDKMREALSAIHDINLENVNEQFKTFGSTIDDIAKSSIKGLSSGLADVILKGGSLTDVFLNFADTLLSGVLQAGLDSLLSSLTGLLFGGKKGGGGLGGLLGGGDSGGGLLDFVGSIFGGGGGLGGILGFASGGEVPYISGSGGIRNTETALGRALKREGANAVISTLTPGERVLTREENRLYKALHPDGILNMKVRNFNKGGELIPTISDSVISGISSKGSTNVAVNASIESQGGKGADERQLAKSIRAVVIAELKRQDRIKNS